ncbi:MAG: TRAP transporter large permease subunit, partial [Bacteroidota bacterium]
MLSHLADWLGPIFVLAVLAGLFTGVPVAWVLGGLSVVFAVLGVASGYFDWAYLLALGDRTLGVAQNPVLLAIPYFIFMGVVLQRSRLAEDLLTTIGGLFGGLRGGLAFAVVGVGALLAAATGVVGASVVAMGTISLPVMMRAGYSKRLASGVIAASGSLGQIIPPSVVLIVLGDQLGVSVGALFRAALVPGIGLALAFAATVAVIAWRRPEWAPPLAPEAGADGGRASAGRLLRVLLPPLALILVVLGSIFAGIATPTEAGALGAVGALVLAAANRRLTREGVRE